MISSLEGSAGKVRAHTRFRRRSGFGLCARTKRLQGCGPAHRPTANELRAR